MTERAVEYASRLVEIPSVSAQSNLEVSKTVESMLKKLGFETELLEFLDPSGIPKANVVGKRGSGEGGIAYFAHTDVVPATSWSVREHGPFSPTVRDNRLYGRGSCDMKGSIACMLAAAERVAKSPHREPLYIVCTADEEVGFHGARDVAERSKYFREMVANQSRAIIGEPTELNVVHAHKGIFGFRVIAHGKAAHSSTKEGINANLAMIPFLAEMKILHDETRSDPRWLNDEFDPPWITMNICISDGDCAVNITAPESICKVYFRPMPGQNAQELVQRAKTVADRLGLEFHLECDGEPLYSDPNGEFVRETLKIANSPQSKTVAYGTDGVMFTELKQILVLGPGSIRQAHTDDEWITLDQLSRGTDLYERLIRRWCL